MSVREAKLALEDGTVYEGRAFGADGERRGEVVFNTAMSGYQEILTDPSYSGQIVAMTYPHIGNYGVNEEDVESRKPWVEGFVAREFSRTTSNFRATASLEDYFRRNDIVGIDDIDTRGLTRRLREKGSLNGVLSTVELDGAKLVEKAKAIPSMAGLDLVQRVSGDRTRPWREFVGGAKVQPRAVHRRIAVYDFGMKWNILRLLVESGCDATVFPARAAAAEIVKGGYDGVFLSNGPGDPAAVTYAIENVKVLLKKEIPVFGICLGHQILALAAGAQTYKLKFGHHGANHPVKRLSDGAVEITSQNHGFAVDEKSLSAAGAEVTHRNLNDGTIEGFRHTSLPAFSVQYHPEAAPGPHDSRYLFDGFLKLMDESR